MSHLSLAVGSIWNTPTRKNIQIYFFHDWARKLQHHDMRGEECCWCVLLLDIPSNSFLKTWQSAKKSILCETRKSIFAGRRWSDSVFLPGRLSAQPWSQEQGTPTPFFPNSSFSLTPRTSQFSAFLLTSRHFTEHTFCSNFSTGPGYLKQFRHLSFIIRKTGKNLPPPPQKKIYSEFLAESDHSKKIVIVDNFFTSYLVTNTDTGSSTHLQVHLLLEFRRGHWLETMRSPKTPCVQLQQMVAPPNI